MSLHPLSDLYRERSVLVETCCHIARQFLSTVPRRSCGQSPYEHSLAVAAVVCDEFECHDPHTVALAVLHDVLEDGDVTEAQLRSLLPAPLVDDLLRLTKPQVRGKKRRRVLCHEMICRGSDSVKLVKLADLLHNLRRRRQTSREGSTTRNALAFLHLLNATPQSAVLNEAVEHVSRECETRHRPWIEGCVGIVDRTTDDLKSHRADLLSS
jgi:(p)ppGpp synthase/HD superfamily hydrolase